MLELSAILTIAALLVGQPAVQSRPLEPLTVQEAQPVTPPAPAEEDPWERYERETRTDPPLVQQEIFPFAENEAAPDVTPVPPAPEFLEPVPQVSEPAPLTAPAPSFEPAPPPAQALPPAPLPSGRRVAAFWFAVPGL
jgi:hypothetical protein